MAYLYGNKITSKSDKPKPKPTPTRKPVVTENTGNPANPKDWTNSRSAREFGMTVARENAKKLAVQKAREKSSGSGFTLQVPPQSSGSGLSFQKKK